MIGVFSDGLTIAQLPQAIAYGMNQSGIMPGKLKGVMIATTPTGWRTMNSSMPRAMSSTLAPIISVGMPQATSTFSMPRRSSPSASASVLPHSIVIVFARSRTLSSRSRFNANRYWMRSPGGVRRHAGNAAPAAATASSTSALDDIVTDAIASPVAGLMTAADEVLRGRLHAPPT